MKVIFPIPRNSLVWLLSAHVAVVLPHIPRIPWWLTVLSIVCAFWRIQVFRGMWKFPGRWLRYSLVLAGTAGILFHYGTFLGAVAGVALLITAFSFKLLEMHTFRDAYIVVILAYFVIAMNFLFEQTLLRAIYGLICFVLVTAALIGINQSRSHINPLTTLKTASVIFLQSIPLMIVFFILVPRVGPLWTFNFDNNKAYTGLSDSMTPGDIASLSQSPKLAFRARFENEIPDNQQLYWRTLILYDFDGRTWRAEKQHTRKVFPYKLNYKPDWLENYHQQFNKTESFTNTDFNRQQTRKYTYDVTMEATGQNYVFALDMPFTKDNRIAMSRDYVFRYKEKIKQRIDYTFTSSPLIETDIELPEGIRRKSLALPETGNSRARSLARQWRSQVNSDEAFIEKVLNHFNQEAYFYTLKPPLLGKNSIDEFLFDTRRGFCAHYAGAFAYLLRSVNIPVRVVTGYQGGEINTLGNYVLVHQFDAHAWTEAWLPGKGWVRLDPTASVSPLRIERGLEDALLEENTFLENSFFSTSKYRKIPLISKIRLRIDYLNYLWHTKIVSYQAKQQYLLLSKWFGQFSYKKMALIMLACGTLIVGILTIGLFWKRPKRKYDPATIIYLKFCRQMENAGIPRLPGESPMDFAKRVSSSKPQLESQINTVTGLYIALIYSSRSPRGSERIEALNAMKKAANQTGRTPLREVLWG